MKKMIIVAVIFSACNTRQTDISKQAAEQIWNADTAMSNLATKEGFFKALLRYADDSLIIPGEGKLPMIGKKEVSQAWSDKPVIIERIWKPIRAEASQSGEMGYSFGYSMYKTKDTTTYSNYCTIWKKQKDGSWKFVYDAGNSIPAPGSFFN